MEEGKKEKKKEKESKEEKKEKKNTGGYDIYSDMLRYI